MIARLGDWLSRVATRIVPDPFVLALLLTAVVFVLAGVHASPETSLWAVSLGWLEGFSSAPLLAFALQMCLVLVTGHALATSPIVQRLVRRLARRRQSAAGAAALVAAVSCVAAVIHWGLGAIVGAFVAREIGRHAREEGTRLHYPILGAAAYAGLAVWHGGLSGSAPLKVAEEGHFAAASVGVIPVSETLLGPLNLAVTGTLCVLIPALFYLMTPKDPAQFVEPALDAAPGPPPADPEAPATIPERLAQTPWLGRVFGGAGLGAAIAAWGTGRASLDLNLVNLTFLFLGLALQGSVGRYAAAVADGARGAGAIIVQFPFYFGILGLMKASGLIAWFSQGFVSIASAKTFPLLVFLSAGLVNFFVPSGGGQWAVQGEIALEASRALGVDPAVTVMAFSYGDAWTNMLQPFWALPLLGIMRLQARDIVGYTAVTCLLMGLVVPALLLLLT